jgi:hypothetical protein
MHAYTGTGPAELVDDTNEIGNKGYIGTTLIAPQRKPLGAKLNDTTKTSTSSQHPPRRRRESDR